MEPYLGPAQVTELGQISLAHRALVPKPHRYQPADHLVQSESAQPTLNKRERKALEKQTWPNTVEIAEFSREEGSPAESLEEESDEVEGCPRKRKPRPWAQDLIHKRRKVSDLDEVLIPSQFGARCARSTISSSSSSGEQEGDQICWEMVRPRGKSDAGSCSPRVEWCWEKQSWRRCNPVADLSAHQVSFTKKSSHGSSLDGSIATSYDSDSQSSTINTAYSLCEVFKGKLVSQEVISGRGGNDGLKFECCNKHQFIVSLSTLNKLTDISIQNPACYGSWCLKCRNFVRKMEERAQSLNSTVISSIEEGFVAVRCAKKHEFVVHYTRNYSKTWWEECKNDEIRQRQESYDQQCKSQEEIKREEQRKLFEEAQAQMEREQQRKEQNFATVQEAMYFEYTVQQICKFAQSKMERYMGSPTFRGQATQTEVYNVYKILYMPTDVLCKSLMNVERGQLNSYYRQLALVLHPDKNKHENATDAFTKLQQAYEFCKQLA